MRTLYIFVVILITIQQSYAYSKYGRSCKDIGCLNNEECVLMEDPCSYYNRDQCGSYPTCKSAGSGGAPTCTGYACPPTQICHLDGGTPKCVPTKSTSSSATHTETHNQQSPSYPAQNPSYPHNPSAPAVPAGGLYPSLTTSRPGSHGYPSSGGAGYSGGSPGSGYPGGSAGSGYPSQGSGYPSQGSGYPSQGSGYPSQGGYPSQSGGYPGYPSQGSGYPSQSGYPGYSNQGQGQRYPQGQYPQSQYPGYATANRQPGYNAQPGTRYGGAQSGSNPLVDKITDQLKTIGILCVIVKYFTVRFFHF